MLRHVGVGLCVRAPRISMEVTCGRPEGMASADRPIPSIVCQPDARNNEVPGSADSRSFVNDEPGDLTHGQRGPIDNRET